MVFWNNSNISNVSLCSHPNLICQVSNPSLYSGFGVIYRGRGDKQTDEEGNDLQELLKTAFQGIASFLSSSAEYYQRLDIPTARSVTRLNLSSKHGHTRFRRAAVSPHGPDLNDVRSLVQKVQDELAFLL